MTKVKDLVTVLVDRVFVVFPIDDERYELVVALGRRWYNRKVGTGDALASGDAHINLTIDAIQETCQYGANALAALYFRPSEWISRLDRNRAARANESLDNSDYREATRARSEKKMASCLVTLLLGNLYERLLVLHAQSTQSS
jgi:hypothetical protein